MSCSLSQDRHPSTVSSMRPATSPGGQEKGAALSTAAQPSAQDVASLIGRIRAQHVRAIFTESSLDPTLERQIAAEAGVHVYANLYGDTLGPPGSPGATYLEMERWNVRAMVAGFLGRPPPAQ